MLGASAYELLSEDNFLVLRNVLAKVLLLHLTSLVMRSPARLNSMSSLHLATMLAGHHFRDGVSNRNPSLFNIFLRKRRSDANLKAWLSMPVFTLGSHGVGIRACLQACNQDAICK